MGDVEGVVFLNKMHHSLAEVKAETPVCTLPVVDAKTSANQMAARLAEVKAVKVCETLTDVKVTALDAGRHCGRGEGQDGWQNTWRRGG